MKKIIALCAALFIAACNQTPDIKPSPKLDFTRYKPIVLNVANIEVVEEYRSPNRAPNVEHIMPVSPADAVHIWVKDRLRAGGTSKLAQVFIKDASVISTDLPKTKGVKGFFTNDQDKKYDARLEVQVRIYGDAALSEADAEATVTRTITIPEDATVAQRKAAYDQMIGDMMELFNATLEKNIYEHMGRHIQYNPY